MWIIKQNIFLNYSARDIIDVQVVMVGSDYGKQYGNQNLKFGIQTRSKKQIFKNIYVIIFNEIMELCSIFRKIITLYILLYYIY